MVARALLAPILVVALAILVKGYANVGDGFAAGVVAALGVLLQVVVFGREAVAAALPLRWAPAVALVGLGIGFAVFAVPALLGDAPLEHAPAPGVSPVHIGSLELITAVVFDVGVFLLVLGASVAIIDAIAAPGEGEQ
ncbi:MnhB domain-containing protein [Solirubrobacter deserti]|nr:MnhB domain-containing protein [Solirubrobacter deserti]